jgi:hypothetical protein
VINEKVRIREVSEVGKEARRVMGVEELKMGKVGEDSLPWLIIMLLSFLPHGTPLHQIGLRIVLSRRQSVGVKLRMCSSLRGMRMIR